MKVWIVLESGWEHNEVEKVFFTEPLAKSYKSEQEYSENYHIENYDVIGLFDNEAKLIKLTEMRKKLLTQVTKMKKQVENFSSTLEMKDLDVEEDN